MLHAFCPLDVSILADELFEVTGYASAPLTTWGGGGCCLGYTVSIMCAPESLVRVVLEGISSLLLATLSQCFCGHLSRRNEPGEPFGRLGSCILFL